MEASTFGPSTPGLPASSGSVCATSDGMFSMTMSRRPKAACARRRGVMCVEMGGSLAHSACRRAISSGSVIFPSAMEAA